MSADTCSSRLALILPLVSTISRATSVRTLSWFRRSTRSAWSLILLGSGCGWTRVRGHVKVGAAGHEKSPRQRPQLCTDRPMRGSIRCSRGSVKPDSLVGRSCRSTGKRGAYASATLDRHHAAGYGFAAPGNTSGAPPCRSSSRNGSTAGGARRTRDGYPDGRWSSCRARMTTAFAHSGTT